MNNKGFTLIEMLIVIVLISILMGLAIPQVIKIMENGAKDQYKTQLKLVEQAANLYKARYKGDFNNSPTATCFMLDYSLLLEEELIQEQDIKCDGKIVYTKNAKKNYKKSYYLNCYDKNNISFSSYEESSLPGGCVILGTELPETPEEATIAAPTITGGNENWVSTNIDITVSNSGIAVSDVNNYQYYISTNSATPSKHVAVTGTTTGKVTISNNGTYYIWYRVVDKSGNISGWSNRQIVNIDKVTPTAPNITPSDSIGSGSTHSEEFALTFSNTTPNVSGNTYYYGTSSSSLTNVGSSIPITAADNGQRIYVKSCNGANICSSTNNYLIYITIPEI